MDENIHTPSTILEPKGQKQVGSLTSWERGKNIWMAMSTSGSFMLPMLIFSRLRMSPTLKNGGPEGSIYRCPKNGWINEELFKAWLEHICKFVKNTLEQCFPTRVPRNIVRDSARNQRKKPWCRNDPLLPPPGSSCFKNYWGGFKTSPWCSCEHG
jgi:hypothetical protein